MRPFEIVDVHADVEGMKNRINVEQQHQKKGWPHKEQSDPFVGMEPPGEPAADASHVGGLDPLRSLHFSQDTPPSPLPSIFM